MPQPPAYDPSTDFSDEERDNVGGRSTLRTAALDAELSAISVSIEAVRANMALNQRDDGEIRDGRVRLFTLASDVLALILSYGATPRGDWTTATQYAFKDLVSHASGTYIAVTAHTAGVFATDLAAGKWLLFALESTPDASGIPFSPTGTIAATNVQAAIDESDTEVRALITALSNSVANQQISVANIAALRLRMDAVSTAVQVEGYYNPGDGGGGIYWSDLSDTTSADNGATIIVGSLSGMRWKLFRTDRLNIKQFGAKGDDLTDDTAAIQNAITLVGSRELYWLRGTYRHSATLVMPAGQSWKGPGGQRAVVIKKMFNGDSVSLTDTNTIRDIDIDGNGGTYTGRGIYVGAGVSHFFQRLRVHDTYDESLEFANNVGAGSQTIGCEFGVINPVRNLTVGAIKLRDNTACPRFFSNIWLSGGLLDVRSGGNGSSFHVFYIRNILTDVNTVLFHLTGGRVASIADATLLYGSDCQITNVGFSGPVFLNDAQGWMLANCTYGAGIFITDASCQYCSFQTQAAAYTPTWDQPAGTPPSLGNGTLTGHASRNGYTVTMQFELTMGSTTGFGNNANPYRISLPYRGHISFDQKHIPIEVYDSSANTRYTVWGEIGMNLDYITFGFGAATVNSSNPVAFAQGDKITGNFTYIAR